MESNIFIGYCVGRHNPTVISHLQFVDDTLPLGVKSWANVGALRVVLVLFEAMLGLKINYHKNMLVGINIDESWLNGTTSVLSCKIGCIPNVTEGNLPNGSSLSPYQYTC